ncbi:MAG: CoA-binding protein [Deltaproteobacteria bacterium]|nr:CoA-binding protein [Deltaproteobacteria bacterium]
MPENNVHKPVHELDRLFYPKSIAVVGATPSEKQMGSGNMFVMGAFSQGFHGGIYPVHPKADYILGLKAYPNVRAIPEEVDLVIFSIPQKAVISVMEDCAARGVKFVHMFTAGFSETGVEESAEVEQKILEIARKHGMRIIGPNCMGIYCPEGGVAFQQNFPIQPGSVGIISQSGSLVNDFVRKGSHQGLKFSKVVSFGNAVDLQPYELLQYLAQDEKTKSIGAYIEGLREGRAFFEAARQITRKKPLVVLKGGQTEGGSRATMSHTASMSGSARIWQALCKQAGIIPVDSPEEMMSTLSALQKIPEPLGKNVAIFGEFGGGSVLMTDVAEKAGLKVPRLSEETIHRLEEFIPLEGHSVKNPLDAGMAIFNRKYFIKMLEVLREDPHIDAMIFIQQMGLGNGPMMGQNVHKHFFEVTLEARKIFDKPILVVMNQDENPSTEFLRNELAMDYHHAGIANFSSFALAARVLSNLCDYREYLQRCP